MVTKHGRLKQLEGRCGKGGTGTRNKPVYTDDRKDIIMGKNSMSLFLSIYFLLIFAQTHISWFI